MYREDFRTERRKPCENTDTQREDGFRTAEAEHRDEAVWEARVTTASIVLMPRPRPSMTEDLVFPGRGARDAFRCRLYSYWSHILRMHEMNTF